VPGIPDPGEPFVLVADELSPVDTAAIDTSTVLGLVTERGGATSHTAIVARSLGLPCVVACPGIMAVRDGTVVAVDAAAGTVEVGVEGARVGELRAEGVDREARLAAVGGPGRTADGRAVALLHNIGAAADLDGVVDASFEGVGLFRTELLFLDRTARPGVAEQRDAYARVLRAAAGRKVVVRTLDAGADKPLPFLARRAEPNPALGVRGLRLARELPDLLDDQLRALAEAASDVPGAEVWVMAPMVSTPGEAAAFVARARDVGLPKAGVMVEVPAAALRARELLVECDFLSVGTNDLAQYTFAADRLESSLQDLLDPWQPALLGLVASCAEAGRLLDRPVGICGEAAADPQLAVVFAGMGITSLSMAARALPAVRLALAGRTTAECDEAAKLALGSVDAASARAIVAGQRRAGS
jgi:phosphotransferase system enzyme I (PtsI)